MPKQYITEPESLGEITTALRSAGFKILLVFSLLILVVIVIAQPQNVYIASFFGLSWCAISIAGITLPDYREWLAKLWAVLTIPVAEDNDINQVVAKSLLEDTGLNVVLANTGKEAVELAQSQPFDLILMDLHMPEMNGSEAALALRQANITIPIIAFTAAVVVEEINKALASGMNGYLTKPVNKTELHAMLIKYLHPDMPTDNSQIAKAVHTE